MLNRLAAVILIACALVPHARAQSNKAQLATQIANCFPDNTSALITPATVRSCMTGFMNSWQQFAGVNAQVGTSYAIAATDYGQLVTFNNASPVAVSIPVASSFYPFNVYVINLGAGAVTITPTTSTINGGATLVLAQNQSAWIVSDNVNYQVWDVLTSPASFGNQTANTVLAGPTSGGAANPTFRALVGADLPNPGASSKGGVQSFAAVAHQWINQISTLGVPTATQPAFTDISGTVPNSQLANMTGPAIKGLTTGTAAPSDLTPGQVGSILCVPVRNVFITGTAQTYTTPTCNGVAATWLEVDVQGGGSGGGGSGSTQPASTAGNASSFGVLTANGGSATVNTGKSGAGGTCSGSLGTQQNFPGSAGSSSYATAAIGIIPGANGGVSFYGGYGAGVYGAAGADAPANSGGGGAGGSGSATASVFNGAGGSAGCHIKSIITSPAATITYTVGGTAAGASAGTSGQAGGLGAAGLIDVVAHWQ